MIWVGIIALVAFIVVFKFVNGIFEDICDPGPKVEHLKEEALKRGGVLSSSEDGKRHVVSSSFKDGEPGIEHMVVFGEEPSLFMVGAITALILLASFTLAIILFPLLPF